MSHPPFIRAPIVDRLRLEPVPSGEPHRVRVVITENATGNETLVPAVVLRSGVAGPVVGVTAAIHGNELNGIAVIHKLLRQLRKTPLVAGTLVLIPLVNVPGYLQQQREFPDGTDLNRIMPGKADGNASQLYAHRFLDRIIRPLDHLFDLHTASTGRENTLYIRADMDDPDIAALARLMTPQIILHNPKADGTLRGAAQDLGIKALTVEVGDPQRLQAGLVRSARLGLQEALEHLGMLPNVSDPDGGEVVVCRSSRWLYTDRGGVLEVTVGLAEIVEPGQTVATLYNIWGDRVRTYSAPHRGIVIGRSTNPNAAAGSRLLHLGALDEERLGRARAS